MPGEGKGLHRFGGVALILAGALFLTRDLLDHAAGPPPSNGEAILAWVASGKLVLSLGNEVLFFASMCLVPGVMALHESLASIDRTKAATGCGIIAVVIPVLAVLDIVHGRLVYPVYGLEVGTPAVAELVVALFYGGLHAILILLGAATLILSLAMRRSPYGGGVVALGLATAGLDLLGAYPDRIGPALAMICQVSFAAWFVVVGAKLARLGPPLPGTGRGSG